MARKISITKESINENAFEIAKEEGIMEVTARKLALKAGCSTQPIFRVYHNMEEVNDEIFTMSCEHFAKFYQSFEFENSTPFVKLGLAYIEYAQSYPNLFRLLFMEEKRNNASLISILNGTNGALHKEISRAKENGVANPSGLFMKMWIFIQGAASMVITKDYDLTKDETINLLEESYIGFSDK